MDTWRIAFRTVTFGAKFDFKRFHSDAEKLKLLKPGNQNELSAQKTQSQLVSEAGIERMKRQKPSTNDDSPVVTKKRKRTSEFQQESDDCVGSDGSEMDLEELGENGSISDDEAGSLDGSECDDEENDDDDDEIENSDEDDDGSVSQNEGSENHGSSKGDKDEIEGVDKMRIQSNTVMPLNEKRKNKKSKEKSKEKLAKIKQEEVNHFRNERRMQVYGEDIPDPIGTFEQLIEEYSISPVIMNNLKAMGFSKPTEIETQAIPVMLNRRELMACAPTGSGKTLAFVLPILHHLKEPTKQTNRIRALVLAPTIELAQQIHREFRRVGEGLGFRIKFIEKVAKVLKTYKEKPKKVDILVTTPNRLVYLMKTDPNLLSLTSVEWLIIDECDKLFEDGKSGFREQLGSIYKACSSKDVRRGLFSATFANDVKEWCLLNLNDVIQVYIGARNAATHVIDQELIYVGDEAGKLMALRQLIRNGFQPPVLIFVQSKDRAKDLFHELYYDKVNVEVIHGDKTQAQRDKIVADFRCGKIWILICTEVMGRGIDFKGVNLVVNYDFPNSAVSYIHRIGRTGRAGRRGKAVTYFANNDIQYLKCIVNVMREAGCDVPDYMLQLKAPKKNIRKKMARSAVKREPINLQRFVSKKMKMDKKIRKKTPIGNNKASAQKT